MAKQALKLEDVHIEYDAHRTRGNSLKFTSGKGWTFRREWTNPDTGKRHQLNSPRGVYYKRKNDAVIAFEQQKRALAKKLDSSVPLNMTWDGLFEYYIEKVYPQRQRDNGLPISATAIRSVKEYYRKAQPYIGTRRVARTTVEHFVEVRKQIEATGYRSWEKVRIYLSSMAKVAIELGLITANPLKSESQVLIQKKDKAAAKIKQANFLDSSTGELKQFFENVDALYADYSRVRYAIYAQHALGLRGGELLSLFWSDIDLENKVVHVNRTITEGGEGMPTKVLGISTKTPAGVRDIFLNDSTVRIFTEWKERQDVELAILESRPVSSRLVGQELPVEDGTTTTAQLVFPNSQNSLWNITEYNKYIKKALLLTKDAFKPELFARSNGGSHMLRHTYGTMMANAGVDRDELARLMGHEKKSTADEYYIGLSNEKIERAARIQISQLNARADNVVSLAEQRGRKFG